MVRYSGPVIDAHIHLWDLATNSYPWLAPGSSFATDDLLAPLRRNYLPADYRADIAGTDVVASVHVEALWDERQGVVGETRWLDSLDIDDAVAIRYVGAAPFGSADTARIIEEQATFPRVRAIRQVVAWDPRTGRGMAPRADLLSDPGWLDGVGLLEDAGLHLELLLYPWQCAEVGSLAARHPELTIIVDHIASPVDQSAEGISRWRGALDALAAHDNVSLKVSSVAGYLPNPHPEAISETIRTILDAFPAERLMFGSDFPVGSLVGLRFGDILEATRTALSSAPLADQQAFFFGTAARLFDIDPGSLGIVETEHER